MKLSLSLCALALALAPLALTPQASHAQSKRMGPSAIEAARLKKYPPNAVLAHYLPDDRYKIAGGVWKYVTTDLDTYYHLPTSSNMMRQPADRVVGFANAHDAEEAGYEPDPTDGTAARVAADDATTKAALGGLHSGGSVVVSGYVGQITALLTAEKQDEIKWAASLRGQNNNMKGMGQGFGRGTRILATYVARLRAIKAPSRYARFHQLLVADHRNQLAAMNRIGNQLSTGQLALDSLDLSSLLGARTQLMQEARRVGINPQLLM